MQIRYYIYRLGFYLFVFQNIKNFRAVFDAFKGSNPPDFIQLKNGWKVYYKGKFRFAFEMLRENWEGDGYFQYFKPQKKDCSIVDIGGHFGSFVFKAKKLFPKAKILSVEPDYRNFEVLERNVHQNQIDNVSLAQFCITGINAQIPFHIKHQHESSTIDPTKEGGDGDFETTYVQGLTLEQLFNNYGLNKVDFVKMDCEGAEFEIMPNAIGIFKKRVKSFVIEYHTDNIHYAKDCIVNPLKADFLMKIEPSPNQAVGLIYGINKAYASHFRIHAGFYKRSNVNGLG